MYICCKRVILLVMLMVLPLHACGNQPDTAPMPIYPDAKEATSQGNLVISLLEGFAEQMQEQEDFQATTHFYTLPDDTTLEQVRTFYDDELTGRGWKKWENAPEMEIAGSGMAGWEHGRDQAFLIMLMPNEITGDVVMMTMEAMR